MTEESDYDIISLVPKGMSSLKSRTEAYLKSGFHGLYPIISSPMKGVSGSALVIAMGKNNCLGVLHRFSSLEDRISSIEKIADEYVPFGIAIGLNDWESELKIAEHAYKLGAKMIVVDLANGHLERLSYNGKCLRDKFGSDVGLMTGNIVTADAAQFLKDAGYDFVRCSIGSGACCTTRRATGIGRNALAVLKECSEVDINLVIDGGIRCSGDIVKSFACGADFAMLGAVMAHAIEAENDGRLWGMASRELHVAMNKDIKSIEGKEIEIDIAKVLPCSEIISGILWDIRSACTYLGCFSYKEIPNRCKIITNNLETIK